jgi:hypothetical protein
MGGNTACWRPYAITIALKLPDDGFVYQYRGIRVTVSDAWRYVSVAYSNRIIEHYASFYCLPLPSFATPTYAHSRCLGGAPRSGCFYERHIAPRRRLVVAALTSKQSLRHYPNTVQP